MRGVFAVGEPRGSRWDLALDLLQRGEPFSLGPVTFRRSDPMTIEADVASSWQFRQVTSLRARKDLEEAKRWIEQLLGSDEAFRRTVGTSSITYVLVDDYETGYTRMCRLVDDDLEWLVAQPS